MRNVLVLQVRVLDMFLHVGVANVMLGMGVLDVLVLHVVSRARAGCGMRAAGAGKEDSK